MQLPARNRQDYVPIIKRNDYTWPCGNRLAVYFCNNLEYVAFRARRAPTPPAYSRSSSRGIAEGVEAGETMARAYSTLGNLSSSG